MILHLVLVPPDADAEDESTAGDVVERRHLLREDDRIVLRDEADAGAELQSLSDRCGDAQRDERVEDVAVLLGQLAAAGPRSAPADRDVGVLGKPEGVVAPTFRFRRQLRRADRIVGGKDHQAEVHARFLSDAEQERSGRLCSLGQHPPKTGNAAVSDVSADLERQTSGATMRLIVEYVRGRAGDRGVRRLLQLAGEMRSERDLCDEGQWSTYAQKIALFEAAAVVLDDPIVARHVGEASLALGVGASTKALLRSLGSPTMVLRNLPRVTGKFSSVAIMEALEIERSRALIAYHVLPAVEPHRADCQYNIGLLSQIGPLFGLPRSAVVQYGCQAEGDRRCIYEVSWLGKAPAQRGRRRKASVLAAQLADLDATFDQVLSTAADLVSDDDVDTVLARITNRAAVAARAAVRAGGAPERRRSAARPSRRAD